MLQVAVASELIFDFGGCDTNLRSHLSQPPQLQQQSSADDCDDDCVLRALLRARGEFNHGNDGSLGPADFRRRPHHLLARLQLWTSCA